MHNFLGFINTQLIEILVKVKSNRYWILHISVLILKW